MTWSSQSESFILALDCYTNLKLVYDTTPGTGAIKLLHGKFYAMIIFKAI